MATSVYKRTCIFGGLCTNSINMYILILRHPFTIINKKSMKEKTVSTEGMLWADKYAPATIQDLVGAPTIVNSLRKWLTNWDQVHLAKTIKVPFEKKKPGARAVLLSGPPGIGKTTTARLIAQECDCEFLELNASDARSKKLISEKLSDVVQVGVLSFGTKVKRRVIIMDEVDGMSSSDRGGIQELIQIIKTSKTPIICICNDMSKSSTRSLANHCYDLRFQRPHVSSIAKRMKQVCLQEGLEVDDAALEGMIESSGKDIRQVLNALQMWRVSSKRLESNQVTQRMGEINKDEIQRLTGFDAVQFIFSGSRSQPLSKLSDAFFVDYDLIPLMIGQHYVQAVNQSSTHGGDELHRLKKMHMAADGVCDADIAARQVRQEGRWGLLTSQALLNVRVAYQSNGRIGFPTFPEWLGKNSNASKRSRLLSELTNHVRCSQSATSVDTLSLRFDYIPAMREVFVRPLAKEGTGEVVSKVIDYLDEYSMNRDDLFETLSELQFQSGGSEFEDYYQKIQSKTKKAFTCGYNKRSHKSQVLIGEQGISKKGRYSEEDECDLGGEEEIDLEAFRSKTKVKKKKAVVSKTKKKV